MIGKGRRWAAAVLAAAAVVTMGISPAMAASKQEWKTPQLFYKTKSGNFYFWSSGYRPSTGEYASDEGRLVNWGKSAVCDVKWKVSKVKNFNKKIATVKARKKGGYTFTPKKRGKAKSTFMTADGVKHTVKTTIWNYITPCKTLKIGKVNYGGRFKELPEYTATKKLSGKISVKPAKGWKLVGIVKGNGKTQKKVKNGQKVTLKAGSKYDRITAMFKYKKNGSGSSVTIYVSKPAE